MGAQQQCSQCCSSHVNIDVSYGVFIPILKEEIIEGPSLLRLNIRKKISAPRSLTTVPLLFRHRKTVRQCSHLPLQMGKHEPRSLLHPLQTGRWLTESGGETRRPVRKSLGQHWPLWVRVTGIQRGFFVGITRQALGTQEVLGILAGEAGRA